MSETEPTSSPQPTQERGNVALLDDPAEKLLAAENSTGEENVPTTYEDMSVDELAYELAMAIDLNDVEGAENIRAIADHKIMDQVTQPDSLSKNVEQEYSDEVTRFSDLIGDLRQPVHAEDFDPSLTPTAPEANPVAVAEVAPVAEPIVEAPAAEAEVVAESEPGTIENGSQVTFEGKEGFVQDLFVNAAGEKMYSIMDTEGEMHFVREESIKVVEEEADGIDELFGATEVEKEVAPVDGVEATEGDAEKKSRVERVKDWFGKNKEAHKDKFSTAYWAARFSTTWNSMLDYRTNEDMSDTEVDRIRNINRKTFIIGSAALGVLGLYAIGASINESISPDAAPVGNADGLGALAPDAEAVAAANAAAEAAQHAAEAEAATTALFDIPRGQGGLELFRNLGIDPSQWAANAPNFPTMFPNDFVAMDGGGVGIKHSGWISPEAQTFIKSLR